MSNNSPDNDRKLLGRIKEGVSGYVRNRASKMLQQSQLRSRRREEFPDRLVMAVFCVALLATALLGIPGPGAIALWILVGVVVWEIYSSYRANKRFWP